MQKYAFIYIYIYIECHHYCDTCTGGGAINTTSGDNCACLSSNDGVTDVLYDPVVECKCKVFGGYFEDYSAIKEITECHSNKYIHRDEGYFFCFLIIYI